MKTNSNLKLDKKYLIILQNYMDNPHFSIKNLSSKLKISRNTIRNRFRRLEKEGFIVGIHLIINYYRLGYKMYIVFMKNYMFYESFDILKDLYDFSDNIMEIVLLYGEYNSYIKFIAKDNAQKEETIFNIINNLNVDDYEIVESIAYDVFPSKKAYYDENKVLPSNYTIPNSSQESVSIDDLDLKILNLYRTETTINSVPEIANILNESSQLIIYRLKRLISLDIIRRYYGKLLWLPETMNFFVKFEYYHRKESQKLFKYLLSQNEVNTVDLLSSKDNFLVLVQVKSHDGLENFLKRVISDFKYIRNIQINLFYLEYSYKTISNCIFNTQKYIKK